MTNKLDLEEAIQFGINAVGLQHLLCIKIAKLTSRTESPSIKKDVASELGLIKGNIEELMTSAKAYKGIDTVEKIKSNLQRYLSEYESAAKPYL